MAGAARLGSESARGQHRRPQGIEMRMRSIERGHVTPCGLARERMSAATITGREFARQRGLADIVGARRGLVLMARGPRRDRCGKIASLRGKSLSALWKPSCIAETMVRKPTPDPGNAV